MLVFMLQHTSYAGLDLIRVPTGMTCVPSYCLEHQGRYMRSLTPYKSNPSLSASLNSEAALPFHTDVRMNPYSRR
jgi:hypothetical protein